VNAPSVVDLIGHPRLNLAICSWWVAQKQRYLAVLGWTMSYGTAVLAVVE